MLAVAGGTSLFLVLAGAIGYAAYGDRPGPGWWGVPSYAASLALGFGLALLPYTALAGLVVCAIVRGLEWARLPRLSVALAGATTAACTSVLMVLAIGWSIALGGAALYVPLALGAAAGGLLLPGRAADPSGGRCPRATSAGCASTTARASRAARRSGSRGIDLVWPIDPRGCGCTSSEPPGGMHAHRVVSVAADGARGDAASRSAKLIPDMASATVRWRAVVEAQRAQSERLRDPAWRPADDFAPPSVASFRPERGREDDARVLAALQALVTPESVVVDVGAGAGRFAIPLARAVREVVAVEPSPAMRAALRESAERLALHNLRLVPTRWEQTSGVVGDVVVAAHVVYGVLAIEPFLRRLDAAARRWAAVLVFEEPPLSWLLPFWPRVHGEERLPAPHLPHLLDVIEELGFEPAHVELVEVEPFELGPPDVARQKLRRRLYVAPGSERDRRLAQAMADLLDDRDGVLVPRSERPIRVGLVRWRRT